MSTNSTNAMQQRLTELRSLLAMEKQSEDLSFRYIEDLQLSITRLESDLRNTIKPVTIIDGVASQF